MTKDNQIELSRRKAMKSTGPKADDGPFRSRLNSLKHDLGAIHVPLPHENPMEYHDLRNGLTETWQPANAQEQMLVDNIASAYFRMQRASRFEAALMSGRVVSIQGKSIASESSDDMGGIAAMAARNLEQAWQLLERYENRATEAYYQAIETLRKLQSDRKREPGRKLREETERGRYLKRTAASDEHPETDARPKPKKTTERLQ